MSERQETDTSLLLANVDQEQARRVCMAFDEICRVEHASIGTVMWCLSQLQARILAQVPMEDVERCSQQFAEMVTAAYPPMVVSMERSRREHEGLPPFDG